MPDQKPWKAPADWVPVKSAVLGPSTSVRCRLEYVTGTLNPQQQGAFRNTTHFELFDSGRFLELVVHYRDEPKPWMTSIPWIHIAQVDRGLS